MLEGRIITIDVPVPAGYETYELRVYSSRNEPIAKESDVSPSDPNPQEKRYGLKYEGMYNFNYLFPVVDFKINSTMQGVITFKDVFYGTCAMNPMYHKQRQPLGEKVIVSYQQLEWWENMFHYDNPQALAESFYISKQFPGTITAISEQIELLTEQWKGSVTIYGYNGTVETVIYTEEIATKAPSRAKTNSERVTINRESLLEALDADMEFIFKSQNKNENSFIPKGTHLFYDYDARTFRQRNWLWTFGPTMRALLDARAIPEIAGKYGANTMLQFAKDLGDICVNFQELDPNKTNYGMLLCRLEHTVVNSKEGYELKYSPPDGLFQVGWGAIPLYKATGDETYLQYATLMADATGKLLSKDVVIQQDWFDVTGSWKTNTMDEAGFGMEGIAELFLETKDPQYAAIGKTYIDQLIHYLETTEGTWGRNYFRHSRIVQPPENQTRGEGWAMMGISSALRMDLGNAYAEKCRKMAAVLMRYQNEDGSWWYQFDTPNPVNGKEEKGTAVWTLMFYRLYALLGDAHYLETARSGLTWLINNQYRGDDCDGYGGVPVIGPMSGVAYRPFFKMACQYTAGFFALSLLEELKLNGK